nr:5'-3' exoribonuclease 2-like [Triticum aestivum]
MPVVPLAATTPTDPRLHQFHNDHISNHTRFKLDPVEHNYVKWHTFFSCVLMQYRVQDHVLQPPPSNPDASWLTVDNRLIL